MAATGAEITSKYLDKKYTHAIADSIGIPAPKTISLSTMLDLERALEEISFPYLIKPSQSHRFSDKFKKKMVIAQNLDHLRQAAKVALDA